MLWWRLLWGGGLGLAAMFTGIAAAASGSGGSLAAASPAPPGPVYEETVTSERDLVEDVGTTRRVDEEDIRQESARTLDEALVRQPGVVVRTGADGVPRIDMRGLRTRHVLLLVDGIPVRNTEDGQFDPTMIPIEIIEDVVERYRSEKVLADPASVGAIA